MPKLTNEELVAICEAELSDIDSESELSSERARTMDYYMGDMGEYIPAPKNRSAVVTRDVLDTVESVLPSLIRIFIDADNAVEFMPLGKEDEDQAKLETDAVKNIFFEQNEGFLNLYSFIKDALISKTGILKTWWEEPTWEREEYNGLSLEEAAKLLLDPTAKYEIMSSSVDLEALLSGEPVDMTEGIDLVLKVQKKEGCVVVDVVTPEEFGVSRDASSPNPKDASFVYHKVEKTVSDLIEEGYDREIVESLGTDENNDDEVRLARRNLSDEQDYSQPVQVAMQRVWVTECYLHVDMNDDGISELMKVTLGGVGSGAKLLDSEEVDRIPFVAITPIILTHKFYGFSLGDLIEDIQEIRTVLFRGILDNTYLANNGRTGANENVNLDDLLVSRPGNVVRTKGTTPPSQNFQSIPHTPLPPETFGLLEVLDGMVKDRTGSGDEVAGLDTNALSNVNTGVLAAALEAARMRIELMARIIAELGLKEEWKDIHELLHKNQSESIQMQIKGNWVDVDPSHWRKGRKTKVTVGLGHYSKQKKLMAIQDIQEMQVRAVQSGYDYVLPQHIHKAISDKIELHGLHTENYFANPENYQPPQKQPDPKLVIEGQKLRLDQQKIEVEREKNQLDAQLKVATAQSREREMAMRTELEAMKGSYQLDKMRVDESNQIVRAQAESDKAYFDMELKTRDQGWKEYKEGQELRLKEQDQELDRLKVIEDNVTAIEIKLLENQQKNTADLMKHIQAMTQMFQASESERQGQRKQIMEYISENGSDKAKAFASSLH